MNDMIHMASMYVVRSEKLGAENTHYNTSENFTYSITRGRSTLFSEGGSFYCCG